MRLWVAPRPLVLGHNSTMKNAECGEEQSHG